MLQLWTLSYGIEVTDYRGQRWGNYGAEITGGGVIHTNGLLPPNSVDQFRNKYSVALALLFGSMYQHCLHVFLIHD
jgi:hypothetical protein